MLGIIDWRIAQCDALGVKIKFECLADVADVTAARPDVVIVATGGFPRVDVLRAGNEFTVSTWDILSGSVKPKSTALIFDDAGDHAALQAAEVIAESGAKLEVLTPDRTFAPEVMAMSLVPYMRTLQRYDVRFTVALRAVEVRQERGQLTVVLGSDYCDLEQTRVVDQVVVNHGTQPADDLYFALKPLSSNLGAVDYDKLRCGGAQTIESNPAGQFRLFRIGDAVSSRNTHAAIYDALRLVKDI
jgi:pyruvate/2-oxoglutarate dehydrogenase complex dihydrolipoamide dehydrogenase (E3) component